MPSGSSTPPVGASAREVRLSRAPLLPRNRWCGREPWGCAIRAALFPLGTISLMAWLSKLPWMERGRGRVRTGGSGIAHVQVAARGGGRGLEMVPHPTRHGASLRRGYRGTSWPQRSSECVHAACTGGRSARLSVSLATGAGAGQEPQKKGGKPPYLSIWSVPLVVSCVRRRSWNICAHRDSTQHSE